MSALANPHEGSSGLRPGDVDLSDPSSFLDGVPHEYFRMLREQDPVHWQEECAIPVFLPGPGYWALTRYDDVAFVSKHPAPSTGSTTRRPSCPPAS
jgi:cytochrome P450